MELAQQVAPEIDRLVLSANALASAQSDEQLLARARGQGLDSLDMLPHYADFLLAGVLTSRVAKLRLRYVPPERVDARLEEFVRMGLAERDGDRLAATERMRPVLEELLSARARVAAELWNGYPDEVETAIRYARQVSQAATPEHEVAVAHREVPEPADDYLAHHTLLTNLRYIRQHDHGVAWSSRGLSAQAMVAMTPLWKGRSVDPEAPDLAELVEAGYATLDPIALTPVGQEVRDAIEYDTNQRAQATFDVLDEAAGGEFLDAVRTLPGTVTP